MFKYPVCINFAINKNKKTLKIDYSTQKKENKEDNEPLMKDRVSIKLPSEKEKLGVEIEKKINRIQTCPLIVFEEKAKK